MKKTLLSGKSNKRRIIAVFIAALFAFIMISGAVMVSAVITGKNLPEERMTDDKSGYKFQSLDVLKSEVKKEEFNELIENIEQNIADIDNGGLNKILAIRTICCQWFRLEVLTLKWEDLEINGEYKNKFKEYYDTIYSQWDNIISDNSPLTDVATWLTHAILTGSKTKVDEKIQEWFSGQSPITISEVNVTITVPVAGEESNEEHVKINGEANYTYSPTWTLNDDGTYNVIIEFMTANDGYIFVDGETTAVIDGEAAENFKVDSESSATLSYTVKAISIKTNTSESPAEEDTPEPTTDEEDPSVNIIREINVTITVPVVGKKPDYTVKRNGAANYECSMTWQPDEIFKEGEEYAAIVTLTAAGDYVFNDDYMFFNMTTAKINGMDVTGINIFDDGKSAAFSYTFQPLIPENNNLIMGIVIIGIGGIIIGIGIGIFVGKMIFGKAKKAGPFPPPGPKIPPENSPKSVIFAADVKITPPAIGKIPDDNIILGQNPKYKCSSVEWSPDGQFKSDIAYAVTICLEANEGYELTDAKINGKEATIEVFNDGKLAKLFYRFPPLHKPEPKPEPITINQIFEADVIITEPAIGKTPDYDIGRLNPNKNYECALEEWRPNEQFKGGIAYEATVRLTLKDGYSFNKDISVTVNENRENVKIIYKYGNSLKFSYIFPSIPEPNPDPVPEPSREPTFVDILIKNFNDAVSKNIDYKDFENKYRNKIKGCRTNPYIGDLLFYLEEDYEKLQFWIVVPDDAHQSKECYAIPSLRKMRTDKTQLAGFRDLGINELFERWTGKDASTIRLVEPAIFEYENGRINNSPAKRGKLE